MNHVCLIGRLTKDPEVRISQSGTKIARFSVAISRPASKDRESQTDFPRVVVLGKMAENCEKYLSKGKLVGVDGRLQTGSYVNEDNITVYFTEVLASRVEFLSPRGNTEYAPDGFEAVDDEEGF